MREKLFNSAVDIFGVNSYMAAIVQNDMPLKQEDILKSF
jgi:hypothetical protein